jgi:mono/diheme cytochrome c family protein
MSQSFFRRSICAGLLCVGLVGCRNAPGKPHLDTATLRPEQVVDFPTLYKQNCSACHGAQGRQGAAISLANSVYLATIGPQNLTRIISSGVPGTLMPTFAKPSGGLLTASQIDVLTHGMIENWEPPTTIVTLPYAVHAGGDATRGKLAYATFCASCHGAQGMGGAHVGSIVDPDYLNLISDQTLRSTILGGKPEQSMPDWRTDSSQRPMTDQEVTDTVAFIATHRPANADPQSQDLRRPHE